MRTAWLPLAARRTSIALDVTVATGNVDVRLSNFGMAPVDDQGGRYGVVPPPDNPELRVLKNSALEGDLVFSGRLNPSARPVTLLVNERAGSTEGRTASSPQLRLRFPVQQQQTGAAEAPDGPEASEVAVAPLPEGGTPLRVEALAACSPATAEIAPAAGSLRPAAEASGGGSSRLGSGGAGAGAIAPGRLSQVEQLRQHLRVRRTDRGETDALPGDVLFLQRA